MRCSFALQYWYNAEGGRERCRETECRRRDRAERKSWSNEHTPAEFVSCVNLTNINQKTTRKQDKQRKASNKGMRGHAKMRMREQGDSMMTDTKSKMRGERSERTFNNNLTRKQKPKKPQHDERTKKIDGHGKIKRADMRAITRTERRLRSLRWPDIRHSPSVGSRGIAIRRQDGRNRTSIRRMCSRPSHQRRARTLRMSTQGTKFVQGGPRARGSRSEANRSIDALRVLGSHF